MNKKNKHLKLAQRKKLVFTCIAVALMLLAMLVVAEITVRVLYPQTMNVYEYDADYIFKFRPHSTIDYASHEFSQTTTFNSQGFKDYEYHYATKPADTFRALVLGDSFTVGLEVPLEKTFVKQLEQRLRAQFPNKNIEVLSIATNGWSTEQELLFLTKEGLGYQPDMVILAYYVGNDQIDNLDRNLFLFDGTALTRNTERPLSQSSLRVVYYFLSAHFHLFNLIQSTYWKLQEKTGTESGIDYNAAFVPYIQKNMSADVKHAWLKTFALLNVMDVTLGRKDIPFVIALIPDRLQEVTEHENQDILLDLPQRALKEYARRNNIPIIDLLPAFQQHAGEHLHFEKDFHWNEAGHALAAEQLVRPTASFIN